MEDWSVPRTPNLEVKEAAEENGEDEEGDGHELHNYEHKL